jgi:hypothetical protein
MEKCTLLRKIVLQINKKSVENFFAKKYERDIILSFRMRGWGL